MRPSCLGGRGVIVFVVHIDTVVSIAHALGDEDEFQEPFLLHELREAYSGHMESTKPPTGQALGVSSAINVGKAKPFDVLHDARGRTFDSALSSQSEQPEQPVPASVPVRHAHIAVSRSRKAKCVFRHKLEAHWSSALASGQAFVLCWCYMRRRCNQMTICEVGQLIVFLGQQAPTMVQCTVLRR